MGLLVGDTCETVGVTVCPTQRAWSICVDTAGLCRSGPEAPLPRGHSSRNVTVPVITTMGVTLSASRHLGRVLVKQGGAGSSST